MERTAMEERKRKAVKTGAGTEEMETGKSAVKCCGTWGGRRERHQDAKRRATDQDKGTRAERRPKDRGTGDAVLQTECVNVAAMAIEDKRKL
jgi:hypothetical protein